MSLNQATSDIRIGQTWRTAKGHEVRITSIASASLFQYPISAAFTSGKVNGHFGNSFTMSGEASDGDRLVEPMN
jgi:hypothetical protein